MEISGKFREFLISGLMITSLIGGFALGQPLWAYTNSKSTTLIQVGNNFPATALVSPQTKTYREYFGIPDKSSFYLKAVKAEIMIVEFLNRYCFHCQQQAYLMNRIYKAINKDPDLKGRVKMLGIGVGNNQIQLEHFRQEKKIPFPLIPDKNFAAFEDIGYPGGTPFTIIVKKENGEFVVKDTHLGLIEKHREYLDKIRQIASGSAFAAQNKGYKSAYQTLNAGATENEIKDLISKRLQARTIKTEALELLKLKVIQRVFLVKIRKKSGLDVWFAVLGSEGRVCDMCHDIHFIYLFNRQGTIQDFIPIYVTKLGNKLFEENDIEKTRKALVGKNVTRPIQYNPNADAVTSASMTSALIFKNIKKGKEIFSALKKEGYTQ